jgi:hypothetical protein
MAYLGQSPFGQTVRTATSVVATAGQTTVYPTGGYTIGFIDVWVNGAKLTENTDFTANDGLSVVFDPALDLDDQVETIAYGPFSLTDAIRRSGDTMSGDLNVENLIPTSNNTYNLGSNTARFNDIYLSNSSIYLGDLILSSNATNVLLSNSSGLIGTMATGGGINTFQYTAANATIDVTTTNGASYSVTLNTGNNSVAGILKIVDSTSNTSATIAATANSVKVAYDTAVTAQNMAANAYSNATSYAATIAGTAYSNAVSHADTVAATAYSNAASYADAKAANAYSNAVAYAASNTYVNNTFAPLAGAVFTGPVSGITTLAAGNTTITGFANISANLTAANIRSTGSVQIDGDLIVSGNTSTVTSTTLAVTDNMIYMNQGVSATITGISSNGTAVVFTANNNYGTGWDVSVTGVNPSSYNGTYNNITSANATHFVVANTNVDAYVSGGTARGKSEANPDIGFAGGYNDGTYAHAGFFRDTTDGRWKVFDGYLPEPDESVYIDTANASFRIADFQANGIVAQTISAGNTTITGYANVTTSLQVGTTLAAGNTTVTGFVNVSTSVAAANLNISGTVAADIITVSNVSQTQTNLQVDPAGTAFLNALIYG